MHHLLKVTFEQTFVLMNLELCRKKIIYCFKYFLHYSDENRTDFYYDFTKNKKIGVKTVAYAYHNITTRIIERK